MTLDKLQNLIERLNDDGKSLRIKGIRINPNERFRYADQIETGIDTYLGEDFQSELDVLLDIKNIFEDSDDSSWMFDDEDNYETEDFD